MRWLYELLQRLYPAHYREEYGPEMSRLFNDRRGLAAAPGESHGQRQQHQQCPGREGADRAAR